MLVLTRRIDETIIINDNIIITVLGIEGDKVKIGITAPREVPVLRQELWQAIREQSQIVEKLAGTTEMQGLESLRKFLASEMVGNGQEKKPADPPQNDPLPPAV